MYEWVDRFKQIEYLYSTKNASSTAHSKKLDHVYAVDRMIRENRQVRVDDAAKVLNIQSWLCPFDHSLYFEVPEIMREVVSPVTERREQEYKFGRLSRTSAAL